MNERAGEHGMERENDVGDDMTIDGDRDDDDDGNDALVPEYVMS